MLSSTSVLGQALNNHTVHEMSLVHVPHAYRCGDVCVCLVGGRKQVERVDLAVFVEECLSG